MTFDALIQQPPEHLVTHDIVRERIADYSQLTTASLEAGAALTRLNHEHSAALTHEQTQRIDAIRDGAPEPKTTASDKLARDIAVQTRTLEATDEARDQARAELTEAITTNREAWADQLEHDVQSARDRLAATIDALEAAHTHLAETLCLKTWAQEFPDRARWNPTGYAARLEKMQTYNGEAVAVVAVLDALRQITKPPAAPAPPPQHVPPGGQQSGTVTRAKPSALVTVDGPGIHDSWVDR